MSKQYLSKMASVVALSPWVFSVFALSVAVNPVVAEDFVYQTTDRLAKDLHNASKDVAPLADVVSSNVLESGEVGAVLSTPPLPTPNLTMDITLNSALDDELTRYYSEIVQEILKNMPRKVSLHGDQASLLKGSRKYDKLNVIAYLPNQDKSEYADPSVKDIRAFSVDFEVPDMLMAKRVNDDLKGIVPLQKPIVVHKGRYEEFLRRVNSIKAGEEIASIQDETLVSRKNESSDEFLTASPVGTLQKPVIVKKAEAVVVKPAPKVKAKAVVKPAVKKEIVLSKSQLTYEADFSDPENGLDVLVQKIKKSKQIKKLNFIGSVEGSFIANGSSIFNARMKRVLSVLDDEGVDTSSYRVSAIVLKARKGVDQSIDVDVVGLE